VSWSKEELMIAAAADLIRDGDVALVGIGLPILAAMLAKKTTAPNLKLIFESGAVDADPQMLPQGPGDFPLLRTAVMNTSLFDALGYVQRGKVDVAFLGAAEIDQFGNLNATVIGDYLHPACRLPGSGGANDMGSGAGRIVVITKHMRRKFPQRVSYITTPGFLSGPGEREKNGLRGEGPVRVITDLGIFGFDEATKRMKILSIHPGVDKSEIIANTQFEILGMDQPIPVTPEKGESVRRLIEEMDTSGLYLGARRPQPGKTEKE
jgi:acyl CoA:acetate/3-ketoacid CoA transferase beta subunit